MIIIDQFPITYFFFFLYILVLFIYCWYVSIFAVWVTLLLFCFIWNFLYSVNFSDRVSLINFLLYFIFFFCSVFHLFIIFIHILFLFVSMLFYLFIISMSQYFPFQTSYLCIILLNYFFHFIFVFCLICSNFVWLAYFLSHFFILWYSFAFVYIFDKNILFILL